MILYADPTGRYIEVRRSDGRVGGRPRRPYIGRVRLSEAGVSSVPRTMANRLAPEERRQVEELLARCDCERDRRPPTKIVEAVLKAMLQLSACATVRPPAAEELEVLSNVWQEIVCRSSTDLSKGDPVARDNGEHIGVGTDDDVGTSNRKDLG